MAVPDRIDAHDDETHTLFLVFAGLYGHAGRGTADLVAVTASSEEARRTFRDVRLHVADGHGWAELTAVSDDGRAKRLSWFGVDRWPRPNPLAGLVGERDDAVELPRRRLRRVGRRR